MDMLCIAAEAQPTGYVLVHGRSLTTTDLARLTGAPEADVRSALAELDAAGVFSRDRKGRIYSRRMVRDARKTAEYVINGRKGGNPDIARGSVPKAQRVRPYRRSDSPSKTEQIFQKTGGHCHWCGCVLDRESGVLRPNTFHVDHVIPVRDGGTNDVGNLVPSCAACNHARARKDWKKSTDTNTAENSDTKPRILYPDSLRGEGYRTESLKEPTESSNTAQAPSAAYAFSGHLIRLTAHDLEAWRRTYHAIPDIVAELATLDSFYNSTLSGADRKRWFIRCSSALDKKHQSFLAEENRKKASGPSFTIGIG